MFTANFGNLLQKLRQVGDVRRNPPTKNDGFYKPLAPLAPTKSGATGSNWLQLGPLAPSASCKNDDATASAGNSNEINEGEELDLVAEVLKHVADKKSRFSR